MDRGHERSKRPLSAGLAGPYGHPFHPILVTIPIGAWVSSFVFDLAAQFGSRPGEAAFAALWLIALGVLGAVAAASVGFLDLLTLPAATPVRRTAVTHALLNITVIVAYAANFWWRYADSAGSRPAGWGPITLSVVSLLALTVSGSLGGKLAYRFGVRVVPDRVQADGFVSPTQEAS